jgi:hypothetical protein
MKKSTALEMIQMYGDELDKVGVVDETLTELFYRFPKKGSKDKAMRWLGFMQGALYMLRLRSLNELKQDSKDYALAERLDRK